MLIVVAFVCCIVAFVLGSAFGSTMQRRNSIDECIVCRRHRRRLTRKSWEGVN
jgi:hypothetical protein